MHGLSVHATSLSTSTSTPSTDLPPGPATVITSLPVLEPPNTAKAAMAAAAAPAPPSTSLLLVRRREASVRSAWDGVGTKGGVAGAVPGDGAGIEDGGGVDVASGAIAG